MNHEHKKMVTWIDFEHDSNRFPRPKTPILMVVDYDVCIGYYDVTLGFQLMPIECSVSNHFNTKNVTPKFWAYLPKHPFEV